MHCDASFSLPPQDFVGTRYAVLHLRPRKARPPYKVYVRAKP